MTDHQSEYENNKEVSFTQVLANVEHVLSIAPGGSIGDDPMERFAEAAARAVEQSGEDVMAAATAHRDACTQMANEIRNAMHEMAKATRIQLNKVKTAAHRLKEAREEYANTTHDLSEN